MKKTLPILIVFILIFFVQTVSAQDYQATVQYLQSQIELLSLQATVSALQNQNGTQNQGGIALTNDTMTWGRVEASCLGGLVLGLLEGCLRMIPFFASEEQWIGAITLGVLLLFLFLRPQGLAGFKPREV